MAHGRGEPKIHGSAIREVMSLSRHKSHPFDIMTNSEVSGQSNRSVKSRQQPLRLPPIHLYQAQGHVPHGYKLRSYYRKGKVVPWFSKVRHTWHAKQNFEQGVNTTPS